MSREFVAIVVDSQVLDIVIGAHNWYYNSFTIDSIIQNVTSTLDVEIQKINILKLGNFFIRRYRWIEEWK